MGQLQTEERTPTAELPASSSVPAPSHGSSSQAVQWPQLIGHALSAGLAAFTAAKALAWFPECLAMVRLPTGGVTHDPWAWVPLALDLAAVVAVASPVSFRSLLELVKALRPPKA